MTSPEASLGFINKRYRPGEKGFEQQPIKTPLSYGRLAETSAFAGAALFLASDASAYVSGHTILVDGGEIASSLFFTFAFGHGWYFLGLKQTDGFVDPK